MKKLIIILTLLIIIIFTITIYSSNDLQNKIIDLLNFKSEESLVKANIIKFHKKICRYESIDFFINFNRFCIKKDILTKIISMR